MKSSKQITIGFWGVPNPEFISMFKFKYPMAKWIDLDIDFKSPDLKILPEAYCKIIKNIINNTLNFKPDLILAPIGKDKCDSGWFAAKILKDMGFNVIESKFEDLENKREIVICKSNLSLKDKVNTIMNDIIPQNFDKSILEETKPKFGFWGVPPNDLDFLDLFPRETHVYGWIRCVEAGTPADVDLEMYVDKDVPTVFYSQAFCSKAQLAKYLADKYDGLFIDIDDYATGSIIAKTEAFLRLR